MRFTQEDYIKEFNNIMSMFGINSYNVIFTSEKHSEESASVIVNVKNHAVRTNFDVKTQYVSFREFQETVVHEVQHILFSDFAELACKRFIREEELDHAEEKVVVINSTLIANLLKQIRELKEKEL